MNGFHIGPKRLPLEFTFAVHTDRVITGREWLNGRHTFTINTLFEGDWFPDRWLRFGAFLNLISWANSSDAMFMDYRCISKPPITQTNTRRAVVWDLTRDFSRLKYGRSSPPRTCGPGHHRPDSTVYQQEEQTANILHGSAAADSRHREGSIYLSREEEIQKIFAGLIISDTQFAQFSLSCQILIQAPLGLCDTRNVKVCFLVHFSL